MKRYACYCMTRNIYHKVVPSLTSLLEHSDAEVFLLTEDDSIGFNASNRIHIINVSDQTFFPQDGPNYHCKWTYMVLMRTALSKIFPDFDRILSLDLDTLVVDDINPLWDTDLTGCYLAACPEPQRCAANMMYVNGGVVLWNLEQMRDGMCDRMIASLNSRKWGFTDQDVITDLCQGYIRELQSMYNVCRYTKPAAKVMIKHFAATPDWYEQLKAKGSIK